MGILVGKQGATISAIQRDCGVSLRLGKDGNREGGKEGASAESDGKEAVRDGKGGAKAKAEGKQAVTMKGNRAGVDRAKARASRSCYTFLERTILSSKVLYFPMRQPLVLYFPRTYFTFLGRTVLS